MMREVSIEEAWGFCGGSGGWVLLGLVSLAEVGEGGKRGGR